MIPLAASSLRSSLYSWWWFPAWKLSSHIVLDPHQPIGWSFKYIPEWKKIAMVCAIRQATDVVDITVWDYECGLLLYKLKVHYEERPGTTEGSIKS